MDCRKDFLKALMKNYAIFSNEGCSICKDCEFCVLRNLMPIEEEILESWVEGALN